MSDDRPTVQYRVAFAKDDEVVHGPDDAAVIVTIPAAAVAGDLAVAYMRGRLKSTGSTAALFTVLRNGEAATALNRLASRP